MEKNNKYDVVIGLEIHIESKTKSKMFCFCLNDADERRPNQNICPICMGHPGTLPVINKQAIDNIIKLGLALDTKISDYTKFDRKNYFYPDLPKGYQISQFDYPVCKDGYLDVRGEKGVKLIRINRIHQEEDAGRLAHSEDGTSMVDFNRAGVPLIELVTEPDFSSALEVVNFAKELQLIARYLDVSNANMEKGEMRIEVNLSLKEKGERELGTKVEVKNLNSFKSVEKAILFEIERQSKLLDNGEKIIQETRGWNDVKQVTLSQRSKEESHEYRYFPEPDLPPLHITEERVINLKKEIPELPQAKRERFEAEYGIQDSKIIEIFIENRDFAKYFEKIVTEILDWMNNEGIDKSNYFELIKLSTNYLTSDLLGLAGGEIIDFSKKITPENFAEFIVIISKGDINSKIAKIVLKEMYDSGNDPSHIIEEKGLKQIDNSEEISKIIDEVLESQKDAVEDYKKGKLASFQFLIGQIMARSKGKINPDKAKEVLSKKLENII
ncbi:MAG TPA: Asp-tRNA(Asn)/Glu-tRNA(Gln) amidotransferase subunit GatB [Candidatus Pacearchaeota archaeon]|nr:Asp-tRNA(Asn)/Glu-tRNA(Gln) amidotransferase subunit GatB [Candidatus Pacearchaeota archaeon]